MSINIDKISNHSVKSLNSNPLAGKVSASNFIFKKSGEFKINGRKISIRIGDNLENIVKKINKSTSGVKAELVKGKSGVQVIELKSKRANIKIDDRKSGIIGDLYQSGQIRRVDKNSRIEYLGKEEIDSSNYLNNLLTGKIKATLANAASSNPAPKANIADEVADEGEAEAVADEGEAEAVADEGEAEAVVDEGEAEAVVDEGETEAVADEGEAEVEAKTETGSGAAHHTSSWSHTWSVAASAYSAAKHVVTAVKKYWWS